MNIPLLAAITAAVLFAVGFFLILQRGFFNRALGLLMISNGANFVLILSGRIGRLPVPPILNGHGAGSWADPIPQALILTALVIGFSVAAFLWALVLRLKNEADS